MTKELYLELVRKLDVLINDEILEREKIFTLSTKTTPELSDMPHAPGVSDKVGNLAVKLAMKQQDINHCIDVYVDLKDEIISQIRTLPTEECDVLYRYYVLGQGLFDISDDMNYSVSWIKILKYRGTQKIKVIDSAAYRQAKKIIKF